MSEKLSWRTEKRKVADLSFYQNNPRKMSEKQAKDLMASLKKFNLVEIPVIDQNNRIIAGNMRVSALKTLGRGNEEIEVRVPSRDLSEDEAKEYLLRSNKNVGEWDFGLLADRACRNLHPFGKFVLLFSNNIHHQEIGLLSGELLRYGQTKERRIWYTL